MGAKVIPLRPFYYFSTCNQYFCYLSVSLSRLIIFIIINISVIFLSP
nr:MAG TPA: hypothetical protein [Microviridae sp.]